MTERGPAAGTVLQRGSVLGDRYLIRSTLGEGGMGHVFEVEHMALGRRFALKVLKLERWSEELLSRFQREARSLGQIDSAHVAQVTDFGIDPAVGPFYVMELVKGETVADRIDRQREATGAGVVDLGEAVAIAGEVAAALTAIHGAGIVHRDIKPSNIGLPDSGPVRVKLLDFGLAASIDDSFLQRITRSQQVLGSLPYMAPEQFHGARPSPAMDLYALGVLLFEMLTGRLPYAGPSTAALIHTILTSPVPSLAASGTAALPPALVSLTARLLDKEPGRRPDSAASVQGLLAAIASAQPEAGAIPPTRVMQVAPPQELAVGTAGSAPQTPGRIDDRLAGKTAPSGQARRPGSDPHPTAPSPPIAFGTLQPATARLTDSRRRRTSLVLVVGLILGALSALAIAILLDTFAPHGAPAPGTTAEIPSDATAATASAPGEPAAPATNPGGGPPPPPVPDPGSTTGPGAAATTLTTAPPETSGSGTQTPRPDRLGGVRSRPRRDPRRGEAPVASRPSTPSAPPEPPAWQGEIIDEPDL